MLDHGSFQMCCYLGLPWLDVNNTNLIVIKKGEHVEAALFRPHSIQRPMDWIHTPDLNYGNTAVNTSAPLWRIFMICRFAVNRFWTPSTPCVMRGNMIHWLFADCRLLVQSYSLFYIRPIETLRSNWVELTTEWKQVSVSYWRRLPADVCRIKQKVSKRQLLYVVLTAIRC